MEESKRGSRFGYRISLAVLITLLVTAYTVGVVSGRIPQEHKIDAINLIIITLAILSVFLLLRPSAFSRVKLLQMKDFKIELEGVIEKQAIQESLLEDINLILPLLLPDTERKHLFNLETGETGGYKGNHSVRTELRRLRSIRLIRMRPNREVGQMRDGSSFNLADYVELTALGKRWVKRIKEIEKSEGSSEATNKE